MKQPLDDFSEPHEWWVYFMMHTLYTLFALAAALFLLVILDDLGLLYPIVEYIDNLIQNFV